MKHAYRSELVRQSSLQVTMSAYVYCSVGFGESTQDLVYSGAAMICENGAVLSENERFRTSASLVVSDVDVEKLSVLRQKTSTFVSVAPDGTRLRHITGFIHEWLWEPGTDRFLKRNFTGMSSRIRSSQRRRERFTVQGNILHPGYRPGIPSYAYRLQACVIGISGGLDSTLALLATVQAFDKAGIDRKGVIGVTMPGYGTTDRTYRNAVALMHAARHYREEISIAAACDRISGYRP